MTMYGETTCPSCGKTGEMTGSWTKGMLSGLLMTGLDPANCAGCRSIIGDNGGAPGTFTDGGFEPL